MIFVSQMVPWLLKPIVGIIAGLPIYYYWIRLIILLYPTFTDRMECLKTKKGKAPVDLVTWIVDLAISENPTKKVHISALVVRLTLIVGYSIYHGWLPSIQGSKLIHSFEGIPSSRCTNSNDGKLLP